MISTVFGLLWLFHFYIKQPWPNEAFYILTTMYIIMIGSTCLIFKTTELQTIHSHIGFHKFKLTGVLLAIILAIIIWICDYFFQSNWLMIDLKQEARDWYLKQNNLQLTFLTSVILTPIIEEMLFRGILLKSFNLYLSKFWTTIIISFLFAIIHFEVLQIPILFFASALYVWLTFKYKSIIPAIIAHVMNNCFTFFYYIAMS